MNRKDIHLKARVTARNNIFLDLMKAKDISGITELSRILDISVPRLNSLVYLKYLAGVSLKNPVLQEVADYFGVLPEDIVTPELQKAGKKLMGMKTEQEKLVSSSDFNKFIAEKEQKLLEESDPELCYERKELKELLNQAMNQLKDRERIVLEMRFGLNDGHPRVLEEVGRVFNVTRSRIREIEVKALRKLKHPVRAKKLREFVK